MYEKLLHKAEKEQIEVVNLPLCENIKGLYCDQIIAINKNIETTAEKACVLAEELGHYYTSAGNILDQSKVENRKQEKKARRWAYEKLVGIIKIIEAYKAGCRNRYELAEFLEVTEEFLENAITYYKEKYGMCYQIDNYILYFEPLTVFESYV